MRSGYVGNRSFKNERFKVLCEPGCSMAKHFQMDGWIDTVTTTREQDYVLCVYVYMCCVEETSIPMMQPEFAVCQRNFKWHSRSTSTSRGRSRARAE